MKFPGFYGEKSLIGLIPGNLFYVLIRETGLEDKSARVASPDFGMLCLNWKT